MRLRPLTTLLLLGIAGGTVGCASSPQVSAQCNDAMITAESETASDSEILDSLDACATSAEWLGGAERHPLAANMTEYVRDFAVGFLNTACMRRADAPACVDAATKGLLDFDLSDPRLLDLQVPRT